MQKYSDPQRQRKDWLSAGVMDRKEKEWCVMGTQICMILMIYSHEDVHLGNISMVPGTVTTSVVMDI